jgi:uncharacterized protein
MRLNEVTFTDAKPVEGYGAGFFRIGGEVYRGPVLAGPNGTTTWGGYEDIDSLLGLGSDVDVLFIGTGSEISHLPQELRQQLDAANIGVEIMASPAACRTYNVLLSEGRRIALALIPV